MELDTVVSPGGQHRHQAALTLRTAGAQYLDVALPEKAALLSLIVDAEPVKPVTSIPGSVRVQLPAKREANTPVAITLLYETPAAEWSGSGTLDLAAPKLAKEIPTLKSQWRLWLPDGFEFSKYESNLAVPEKQTDELLAAHALSLLASPMTSSLSSEREPSRATPPREVLGQTAAPPESYAPMPDSANEVAEPASPRAVANPAVEADDSIAKDQRRGEKPMAGRKLDEDVVKPVKQTKALDDAYESKPALPKREGGNLDQQRLPEAAGASRSLRRTAGLLPVMLELPKHGRALTFSGLYAPERVSLRYDDWWSRARRLWMWFVGGGVLFYLLARPRPWLRTLWAALALSALPLCALPAWTAVCNALLGGWLAALVLNRIAAWCVFRVRKEEAA
jgi:hypothetical protein